MRILTAQEQRETLSMEQAIDAVGRALAAYSTGRADSPIRTGITVPGAGGISLFMPALVAEAGGLGLKMVSVFPRNKELGKKAIYGVVVLADVETGEPLALLEASYLTTLRTGAVGGLGAKLLSRQDSRVLALIGTGAQAAMQVRGVLAVRPISEVRLYNHHPEKAERFAREMAQEWSGGGPRFVVCSSPEAAVVGADILVTATNSQTPVFPEGLIGEGVHVTAVGSFRPNMRELPPGVIRSGVKVAVEGRELALEETGDLLMPIAEGRFRPEQLHAEIGEIVAGRRPGRERAEEITVFKSVGMAAMDMVVGRAIYDRAVALGLGMEVDLGG